MTDQSGAARSCRGSPSRDTLALCGSYFFCLLSVYVGTNWVPSLLTGAGFDVGVASYGLTVFNLGGVVGAILGAILIARLGSRTTMLAMTAGAVAGSARPSPSAGLGACSPRMPGRGRSKRAAPHNCSS